MAHALGEGGLGRGLSRHIPKDYQRAQASNASLPPKTSNSRDCRRSGSPSEASGSVSACSTPDARARSRLDESATWRPSQISVRRKEAPEMTMLSTAVPTADPDSRHLFTDVFDEILPHIKAQEDGLKQHVLRYRDHYPEVAIDAWD